MQKSKRWVLIALLVVVWGISIAAIKALLAPATGAATVLQFDASDVSFLRAMSVMSASSVAIAAVSLVVILLMYLVFRAK